MHCFRFTAKAVKARPLNGTRRCKSAPCRLFSSRGQQPARLSIIKESETKVPSVTSTIEQLLAEQEERSPAAPPLDRHESCPQWLLSCTPLENDQQNALPSYFTAPSGHPDRSCSTEKATDCERSSKISSQRAVAEKRRSSSTNEVHMLGGWGALLGEGL